MGYFVETEWLKTPERRPDMNLQLGEFVVMPNHFHGILMFGENQFNSDEYERSAHNRFGPQAKNLASVLRGFKSAVTSFARKNNIPFGWQSRYYDHLIRTKESFDRISRYIIDNPAKWEEDRFWRL